MRPLRIVGWLLAAGIPAAAPVTAWGDVFSCKDATGKTVMSQQEITNCVSEQTRRRANGTTTVLAPPPTAEAHAASAAAVRQAEIERENKRIAERADLQLLKKYPSEATHRWEHVAELAAVNRRFAIPQERFVELAAQRKPLSEQAEFYAGKAMPAELKRAIDANDAAFAALADTFRNLRLDVVEIEARFGPASERLRKLWAGAPPGSMGLLAAPPAAASGPP